MNFASFERGQVAGWAYRKARHTGSLDCIKALAYIVRNRVKAGWGDGTWLWVIENHWTVEGNETAVSPKADYKPMDASDRMLQLFVREIDGIYDGSSQDDTKRVVNDALYFQFVDLPPRPWFVENIVERHEHHRRVAGIGTIAFFA